MTISISAKQRRILLTATGIILLIFIGLTISIPAIAKKVIAQKIDKIEQSHHVDIDLNNLKIKKFSLFGNFTIQISHIRVCDQKAREDFLNIQNINTEVQVWKGFHRTLILKKFNAEDLNIHVVKENNYHNYHFLTERKRDSKSTDSHDYRKAITKLLEKVENFCPNKLKVKSIDILTDIDSVRTCYTFSDFSICNGKGSSSLLVKSTGQSAESWNFSCTLDKKKHAYEGTIVRNGSDQALGSVPFMQYFEGMDVRLHELSGRFTLGLADKQSRRCRLSGRIRQLQCQHHYLADVPVRIDSVGGDLKLNIFAHSFEIDSTSTVHLNRAALHPYLRFDKNQNKHIYFKINERDCAAEPLFASLPADLFQSLPKMKIEGKMGFNCLFDCNFGEIDSLKFDFNLINQNRSIHISEGLGEITRFNEAFEYTFYDHGEPIRTLIVGPENPYFCPSNAIPNLMKQAILASEDGAFFVHNGFCKSAMQSALVDDLKAGKMRRGGSTITMQLVKNLFLSRKKVLSRKFEEMLLVWLIEDQHLISKDRMFEIYVNIIEWAPGIIGLGEASQFYFHKKPSELTMPECIYLATLIRSPKHYASTLNNDGSITDTKRAELEFVADRMVIREFMTAQQRATFDSNVKTVRHSF